jgi:predicted CXXCH cytochrome family protein
MNHRNKRGLFESLLAATVVLLVSAGLLWGGTGSKSTRAAPQDQDQYIGTENCKSCHEDLPTKDYFKNFEATPHWKTTLETRRGKEYQGCEACHGPGAEHMNSGGDKTKIFGFKDVSAKKISQQCLKCHEYGEEHSNYARSAHNMNNVSCVDCHSVHKANKADFNKPFRHRVNEELLKCTDCHNQHGGFLTRGLRATAAQDQVCFKCHTDKAGPYVFEHAPVKTEGCVACHVPHGSSNPRLLKRSQINLLCLECHTLSGGGLPPVGPSHDQSQKYQACTVCHTQIHGSNFSAVFFK